jgi:hypothetical protein
VSAPGAGPSAGAHDRRLAAAWLLGGALVRLLVAAGTPLFPDEAYYWEWSRRLAGGYFDHPPAVAWLIAGGTAIAGDTPLGVRLGTLVFVPFVASCETEPQLRPALRPHHSPTTLAKELRRVIDAAEQVVQHLVPDEEAVGEPRLGEDDVAIVVDPDAVVAPAVGDEGVDAGDHEPAHAA